MSNSNEINVKLDTEVDPEWLGRLVVALRRAWASGDFDPSGDVMGQLMAECPDRELGALDHAIWALRRLEERYGA